MRRGAAEDGKGCRVGPARPRAPWVAGLLALGMLALLAWPAEARRPFLVVDCLNGCAAKLTYGGFTFKRGLAYWIVDWKDFIYRSSQYKFVDESGKIRTLNVRRSLLGPEPPKVQWRSGWEWSRPAITEFNYTFPHTLYRKIIKALLEGFPLVQIVVGGILVGIFWLSRYGHRALGRYGKDEAGVAMLWIAAGLLFAGLLPGEQHQEIVRNFESLKSHAQSRQIGSGLYLPLDMRYGVYDTSWYWFFGLIYGTALIGGGAFIIGWLVARGRALAAGIHYIFVPHPAAAPVTDALQAGWQRPIDGPAVRRALEQTPDPRVASPPAYISKVKATQAEELRQRLEAEAKLVEAVKNREKARAEAEFWSKQVREHERQRRR